MTQTERTEILPKLRPKIIDLKFTRTENDPYRTELNPNIFFLNHFSFQEKSIEPKISWPEIDPTQNRTDPKLNTNRIMLTENDPIRS